MLLPVVMTMLVVAYSKSIIVYDSTSLEHHLCNDTLESGMTLVLFSFTDYIFYKDMFCVVQNVSDVSIKSTSSGNPANIICNGFFVGFGFFNTCYLKIEGLNFINCGAEIKLPFNVAQFSNGSGAYLMSQQMAILLLSHCSNTTVHSVSIQGPYHGFGILSLNALGVVNVSDINITGDLRNPSCVEASSSSNRSCSGSGIVFAYMVSNFTHGMQSVELFLSNILIQNSSNYYPFKDSFTDIFNPWKYTVPILSGTGLSFLICSNMHQVKIVVSFVKVVRTRASHAGSILVVYYNFNTHPRNFIFMSNLQLNGSSLYSLRPFSSSPGITILYNTREAYHVGLIAIILVSVIFANNTGYKGAGVLLTSTPVSPIASELQFYDCVFLGNKALVAGSAVHIESSTIETQWRNLTILLAFSSAIENSHINTSFGVSVFSFTFAQSNIIIISCNFIQNNGSVIEAYSSIVNLHNTFLCANNTSNMGSCLLLKGMCLVNFNNSSSAVFKFNRALVSGGAIYSDGLGSPSDICTLIPGEKVNVTFENNSASLDGYDIKVSHFYNCTIFEGRKIVHIEDNWKYYQKMFTFHSKLNRSISSRVRRLRPCGGNNQSTSPLLELYSGKTFQLALEALDAASNPVYTSVTVSLYPYDDYKWSLEGVNYYNLYADKCNTLNFTIMAETYTDSEGIFFLKSVDEPLVSIIQKVKILPCPLGFDILRDSKKCGCSSFLQRLKINITCNIDNGTILLPPLAWFGMVDNSTEAFSPECPPKFCRSRIYSITSPDSLCSDNRRGIMCGQCADGLSVVFGSDECKQCSSLWLLSLGAHAVAGLLLVVALFMLKLTIAGGILGPVIFFANMSVIGLHTMFLSDQWYATAIRIIISLGNLNLGFPVCFYNGMNSLSKAGLQFVFPVYLWLIVLIFILISRYSVRISNLTVGFSVQVLATLIHFSFAKLLLVVSNVLTLSSITTSSDYSSVTVWYSDGSVHYLHGMHCTLFILSLVVIIIVILPYLILTTTGSIILKQNRLMNLYMRPLIDAYHGPYKDKYRFWFGIRQWILTLLYVFHSVFRGTKPDLMLAISNVILVVFIFIQISIKPYKSKLLNILDIVLLVVLYLTNTVILYFMTISHITIVSSSSLVQVMLSIYLCFCFVLVLYHGIMSFRKTRTFVRAKYELAISKIFDISKKEDEFDSMSREPLLYENFTGYN